MKGHAWGTLMFTKEGEEINWKFIEAFDGLESSVTSRKNTFAIKIIK